MTALSSPRAKRSSRRRLWLFFFLALPLVLIAAVAILVRQAGTDRLTKAIAEADRLDPGWRLDDIEASRKPVPPAGKNGIEQVLAIKAARIGGQDIPWSFPAYEKDQDYLANVRKAMDDSLSGDRKTPRMLNEEQVRVLRAERQRNEKAIALARALVDFEYGRFQLALPIDLYSISLAHSQDARAAAALRHDALLRAHDGDMLGALQDFRAIVHASRAVGDEPFLISQLVRIALDTVAVNSLERSLGLGQASEQDLVVVQRYLTDESHTPFYLYGVRGERRPGSVPGTRAERRARFPEVSPIGRDYRLGAFGCPHKPDRLSDVPDGQIAARDLLECMNLPVEIGKLPTDQQAAAFTAWDQKLRELSRFSFARLVVPACAKVAQADVRTKAILRVAMAGVAAERFRVAKGHWPKELAELVPSYLDAVPLDPFDGKPLRLKISDGAFVVYSVGMDGVDNGGQLDDKPFLPGSDIGFRLFRCGETPAACPALRISAEKSAT